MRVVICNDAHAVGQAAATKIGHLVRSRGSAVLGLATGGTPTLTYRELIVQHQSAGLDFSRVVTFNLDEYVGLPTADPNSYRSFMEEHLFRHVNISPGNTHVPNGQAACIEEECADYEAAIRQAGGIDLQLLGIGRDGHIGFNEPGSSLASRTRWMMLARETILDNARFFGTEDLVPRAAITMGVGTILEARQILLLATGEGKAEAVRAMIEGPMTSMVTASALQNHPDATILLDPAAAHKLDHLDYYLESERLRAQMASRG